MKEYPISEWFLLTIKAKWRNSKSVRIGLLGLLPFVGDKIVEWAGLYRTSHCWRLFDPDVQYAWLCSYTDKDVTLSGEDPPPDHLLKSISRMKDVVPVHLRHLAETIHIPAEKKTQNDPIGQRGYIGWEYTSRAMRPVTRVRNPFTGRFSDVTK